MPVPGPATTIWGPSASAAQGPVFSSSRISVNTLTDRRVRPLREAGDLRDQLRFDPCGEAADGISERVGVGLDDGLECLEVAHIGQAIGRV